MKTVAEMTAYLDSYDSWGTIHGASRDRGINKITPTRWLAESRAAAERGEEASSVYYFPYRDHGNGWLHEHQRQIRKSTIEAIEMGLLIRARDGIYTDALYQSKRQPIIDHDMQAALKSVGLPAEDADCYKRGPDGKILYQQTWTPPNHETSVAALSAFSRRWTRRTELMVSTAPGGAVQHVHSIFSRQPLPPPQQVEVIEPPVVEAVFEDVLGDLDQASTEEHFTEPEPTPEPPEYTPPVLSPLALDLLNRARERGSVK